MLNFNILIPAVLLVLVAAVFALLIVERRRDKARVPRQLIPLLGVAVLLSLGGFLQALNALDEPVDTDAIQDAPLDDGMTGEDYTFNVEGDTTVRFTPDGRVIITTPDGSITTTNGNVRTIHRALDEFDAGNLPGDADPYAE